MSEKKSALHFAQCSDDLLIRFSNDSDNKVNILSHKNKITKKSYILLPIYQNVQIFPVWKCYWSKPIYKSVWQKIRLSAIYHTKHFYYIHLVIIEQNVIIQMAESSPPFCLWFYPFSFHFTYVICSYFLFFSNISHNNISKCDWIYFYYLITGLWKCPYQFILFIIMSSL